MAEEDFMSFDRLDVLRRSNASWKLLASDDAAFCCAFFYREFIREHRRNLPEELLLRDLRSALAERAGEDAKDSVLEAEAKEYLKRWSGENYRWLRRFYRNRVTCYDLTTAAQKAVEWLAELRERSFIGTESRLHVFFHLLGEIEHDADPDREVRRRHLVEKKKEIEREIRALDAGGAVEVLSDVQIRERFLEAMRVGESILSDFREVKDQFQSIHDAFRREVNEWVEGKGGLIERFLEHREVIERSDQGKSFEAFFDYLMAPDVQRDFDRTVKAVLGMESVTGIPHAADMKAVKRNWIEGAEDVQQTVEKLSKQISRYVNEKDLEEKRNIYFLIREISRKTQDIKGRFPRSKAFMELDEGAPYIELPMERRLSMPKVSAAIRSGALSEGRQQGTADALFRQIYVDKKTLIAHIRAMLEGQGRVTLAEVIERYPMKAGLLEMLTYLSAAKELGGKPVPGVEDTIRYTGLDGKERCLTCGRILFVKGKGRA